MDEDAKPNAIFWIWAANSIRMLASAGLTDLQISCVLSDIRAAALHEERHRMEQFLRNNPPAIGIRWPVMECEMKKWAGGILEEGRNAPDSWIKAHEARWSD